MKNITLSVDDATYQHARIVAARRGTSVSAMVRDYLRGLQEREERQNASWKHFWKEFDAAGAEIGERPSRARTYDDPRLS
jgi:plasmid stability protein